MRKLLVVAALVVLCSAAATAQVTTTWNFDDDTTQSWITGANMVDPTKTAVVGDYVVNPAGGAHADGLNSLALYLPDRNYAYLNITPTNSFVFESDVMFNATNRLQGAGLGYHYQAAAGLPYQVSAWFEGKGSGSSEMIFRDTYAVGSPTQGQTGCLKDATGTTWAGMLFRMKLDYNNTTPGKAVFSFTGINFTPYIVNAAPKTLTWTYSAALGVDPTSGGAYQIDALRLGGEYSWSQSYFDNVTFTNYNPVPEPSSLVALGTGLIGLMGVIRRRK